MQFESNWISAKTLVDEITKTTTENELPANKLAEALPDSLKDALSDRRKNGTIVLSRWLEKRVKIPYGSDHIRIERDLEKPLKVKIWRVVRVVAGSPTASSQEKKRQGDRSGNTTCNPPHEDFSSRQKTLPNVSTRHLSDTSPSEPSAGSVQFAGDVQSSDDGSGTKQSPAIGSSALTPGPCSTRFEKVGGKVAHEEAATQVVAGYAWCNRVQQQWMAYDETG